MRTRQRVFRKFKIAKTLRLTGVFFIFQNKIVYKIRRDNTDNGPAQNVGRPVDARDNAGNAHRQGEKVKQNSPLAIINENSRGQSEEKSGVSRGKRASAVVSDKLINIHGFKRARPAVKKSNQIRDKKT